LLKNRIDREHLNVRALSTASNVSGVVFSRNADESILRMFSRSLTTQKTCRPGNDDMIRKLYETEYWT